MAVKVGSTTVINDRKELTNITNASGKYGDFHAKPLNLGSGATESISFTTPVMIKTMTTDVLFSGINLSSGKTAMLLLDTGTSNHVPTFNSSTFSFATGTEPTWENHRYWVVTFVCWSTSKAMVSASGYDF